MTIKNYSEFLQERLTKPPRFKIGFEFEIQGQDLKNAISGPGILGGDELLILRPGKYKIVGIEGQNYLIAHQSGAVEKVSIEDFDNNFRRGFDQTAYHI